VTGLAQLRQEIVDDPANAAATQAGHLPLYAAEPGARIAIIGQAPGRAAQERGRVWDDPSGVTLRTWLDVTDEQFYDPGTFALLPMDFYYPGPGPSGDLPPRKDFAPRWHPRILDELTELRLTILIGGYAQKYYLRGRAKANLTQTVRAFREYLPGVLPLVHPSPLNFRWQAKNPWFAQDVLPVLKAQVRAART
jgi:uracil-DNA glycosylase